MPRDRNRGGRPSKFTTTTVLSIVADISEGRTRDDAARSAGVGASTLYLWIQKGRAGDPEFAPLARAIRGAESGSSMGLALTKLVAFGKLRF